MRACGIMNSERIVVGVSVGANVVYSVKWAVADSNAMLFDAGWFMYVCVLNSQRNYSSMLYCYFSWYEVLGGSWRY